MNKFNPAQAIQDHWVFGEFGGVNPSVTDATTFTFLHAEKMKELFDHEMDGCFLYARQTEPINQYLSKTLAAMEETEEAIVTASGMSAIVAVALQLCNSGDEIISSRKIYGGTYALFKNFMPRFGITVKFVEISNIEDVEAAITKNTKYIYTETLSNPLLEVANIPELSKLAHAHHIKLVVDNTFTPLILTPAKYGADVVIHSITKYINGASDVVAGCICASRELIYKMTNATEGVMMLLGAVLDSLRASSIRKNLHTLHVRMKQHSKNALYLAQKLEEVGMRVFYPGLQSHHQHELMSSLMNHDYGYSGMITFDAINEERAVQLLEKFQENKVGYLAVSLGFYKTLFIAPGKSTSSEIPEEEKISMGLSDGFVRMSVGLDDDIEETFERMKKALVELKFIDENVYA